MADIFSSHPYNRIKDVKPTDFVCETCGITMKYADHGAHLRGKKHKAKVEQAKAAASAEADTKEARSAPPVVKSSGTGCRNCGLDGHFAKECTEPRSAANVECRKCKQLGHFAKDCPSGGQAGPACHNCGQEGHISRECTEPRNPNSIKCRNCDNYGHMSKDCPEPKNWSKVKCNNCGEFGHFQKRCSKPPVEPSHFDNTFADVGGINPSGGWDAIPGPQAVGGWTNDGLTVTETGIAKAIQYETKSGNMWDSVVFESGDQINPDVKW